MPKSGHKYHVHQAADQWNYLNDQDCDLSGAMNCDWQNRRRMARPALANKLSEPEPKAPCTMMLGEHVTLFLT
jgi:hypothetical protein